MSALVELRNDFHDTSTRVRPDARGIVTAAAYRRATRRLCASPTCLCGQVRGPQVPGLSIEHDADGNARVRVTG